MSNILATVGRNVQYVDAQGVTNAAVITLVAGSVVDLRVFSFRGEDLYVKNVKEFNAQARESQANVYKLTWQGR